MTKKLRPDFMPFHSFTGAVRIKTGQNVSESNQFKINMQFKERKTEDEKNSAPKYPRKRTHKYYGK